VPYVVAIAGPNGAGKTTIATTVLSEMLGITQYVNADTIARGLSEFDPESVAIEAGRQNLRRLEELASAGESFAFETTLSGKSYAARIKRWKAAGCKFLLFFYWLPDVEIAVERVAERVQSGGHNIPEAVIRQRYERGIANFFEIYRPLAEAWIVFDNTGRTPHPIAFGSTADKILERASWERLLNQAKK